MAYGIRLKVWGERACFTRPEMKVERVSYDVITPPRRVAFSKPFIGNRRFAGSSTAYVLKPIRFESLRRNEVGGNYLPPVLAGQ